MLTRIQKWGNSLALPIPKAVAIDAHLENGTVVDVTLVGGQIVIKPTTPPVWTLEKLLAGINKTNLHDEIIVVLVMGTSNTFAMPRLDFSTRESI